MKTQQFTPAALNEAIAIARGWKIEIEPDGTRWVTDPDGNICMDVPDFTDFTGDIADAMPLLRELRVAGLRYFKDCVMISWAPREGISYATGGVHMFRGEIGKEAQAISCAWWQFTKGEIVEIVNE